MKTIIKSAALAMAGTFAFGTAASAVTCDASYANNVTANGGCEIGSVNNDNPLPGQVNSDAIFGFADWSYIAKDNTVGDAANPDEGDSGAFTVTGTTTSGTWSILDMAFDTYMMVFKGGQGNIAPEVYVAYLMVGTSGDYTSPFANSRNGNLGEISHVTLYGRNGGGGGPTPVPVPAGFLLLGTALAGFGFAKRRKT